MLNDELISAYLDDELDAERRAMVEQHLRTDSGAAARLERMRAADGVLREAFPALEQPRDNLLATMILAPTAERAPRRWAMQAAALAAAAVIGMLVGQSIRGNASDAPFAISSRQAALLNTLPSGQTARIGGAEFEAIISVASDAGDICRQFRMTSNASRTDVLACHQPASGAWTMVAAAPAPVAEAYIPAGANSPIDVALQSLGPAEALDAEGERAMIARGWR
ncbi:MAG: zf-HC2 domain-containing protein [Terricaulis sp.]